MERDENSAPTNGETDHPAGESPPRLRRRNVTFSNSNSTSKKDGEPAIAIPLVNGILSESNASPKNGVLRRVSLELVDAIPIVTNTGMDGEEDAADLIKLNGEEKVEEADPSQNQNQVPEAGAEVLNGSDQPADGNDVPPELPGASDPSARRDSVDSSATTCSNNNNNMFDDEMDMDVDEGDFGEEEAEGEGEEGDYYDDYEYDPYSHEWVPKIKDPPSDEDSEAALLVSKESRDRSLSTIAHALLESARSNNEAYVKEREGASSNPDEVSFFDEFLMCCGTCRRLCRFEEMPAHLQFNKYIHTGYRHIQDAWGCVLSLLYLHNETLNIVTHLAPIIYVLLYWRTMFPWDEIQGNLFLNILGWSHIIASIAPWIGSVCYHTLMSHNSGPDFYQFLLQVDMFGIWLTECFGALTNLSAATWCLPDTTKNWIIGIYGTAAVFGLQKALTAWTPVARRLCFAPVFISRILGIALRLSSWGGGEPSVLLHVFLQDIISVGGGIVGVVRIPEKWFPGKLDLWFNSHHIMHIMVVIAVVHMNLATNGDIRWIINNYSGQNCSANALPATIH